MYLTYYTKFDTAVNHILADKRLKFSRFKDANDPMEVFAWGLRRKLYKRIC